MKLLSKKGILRSACSIIVIAASLLFSNNPALGQCAIIPNAVPNLTLTYVVPGGTNATGVAYNPNFNVYYAAVAGNPGFPLETFNAAGVGIYQTNTGFDMRGLWWNPNTNQLESNGYNAGGIWSYNINATGYALNTGTSVFTGYNQPTVQSVGDYNCVDNEIIYYNAGVIMRRSRATNALIGNLVITGLPVGTGNLNNNSVFYTDCPGHEIGLVDYVLKRIYFIDKATGAYMGMSQLPASAVTNNSFRASWANGMAWLYNTANVTWYSYEVLTNTGAPCSVVICTPPNLVIDDLTACSPNTVDLNNAINATSDPGNATFYNTLADATAATNAISAIVGTTGTYYIRYEDPLDPTCFTTAAINVTINPVYNTAENVDACENETVTYPDGTTEVITASTSYVSNLLTVAGCDSIITTNVTMQPIYDLTEDLDVCENASVTYPDGVVEVITVNTSHISNLLTVAGCDSVITTNVTMLLNYNLVDNINACENSSVTYPDGVVETITANTSHVSNLTSAAGCDSVITTNVTMDLQPDPGTNGSVTFCSNDPSYDLFTALGGTPDAGGTWTPTMTSGTGMFNPSIDPAGVYTYEISGGCGTFSADVTVTVNPSGNATFSYPTNVFCLSAANPVATITGTSGGVFTIEAPGVINSATGEIDIAASGVGGFGVTYTTSGPCPAQYVYDVSILPAADASIDPAGPFCANDPALTLQALNSGGTWSGPGVDPATGLFDPALANIGSNTITYTIAGSCGDAQSITIEVTDVPTVSTIDDTIIVFGNSVNLYSSSSVAGYIWSPSSGLDCSNCLSPIATPDESTTYTITVEDNGCFATAQVNIIVEYDPVVYVPNIFSPNGDGNNDVLFVRGKGIESFNFVVYDRWGEKVFQSISLESGWDGSFRGKAMNPAVFMYYLDVNFKDGTAVSKKGDVTLIR